MSPAACRQPPARRFVLYHPRALTSLSSSAYILETHALAAATEAEVYRVDSFLSVSEPSITSLLVSEGHAGHTLKYALPRSCKDSPITLHIALLRGNDAKFPVADARSPLDKRLALMKRLASAVSWVDKSTRADNIVLFRTTSLSSVPPKPAQGGSKERRLARDGSPRSLDTPLLPGFDLSRTDAAATPNTQTTALQKVYYIPPGL